MVLRGERMETKICIKCGKELPLNNEFFNTRKDSKDGFRNNCRDCQKNKTKLYGKEHPKEIIRKKYNIDSLEGEIWKDVVGYEGLYQVSNLGRIKSYPQKIKTKLGYYRNVESRILSPGTLEGGYKHVALYKNNNNKSWRVHRLVALAFIPNPLDLPEVNHKDENPSNNKIDNLEWCTPKYNSNYGTHIERMAKSKSRTVYQYTLEGKLIRKWESAREHIELGYRRAEVNFCCKGKRKQYKNSIWSYDLITKEGVVVC